LLIIIAGWISAVLVFSSFFMKTMVPLRMVAICSNVAFITYALLGLEYGVFGRVYPIFVLHAALLPLNVVRLRQLKSLLRAVEEANADETIRSLCPYMDTETHAAGAVLFRKGDAADRLYVIDRGRVRFPEIAKVVSAGEVFGEVGVFAVENVRTLCGVRGGLPAARDHAGQGARALLPGPALRLLPHPPRRRARRREPGARPPDADPVGVTVRHGAGTVAPCGSSSCSPARPCSGPSSWSCSARPSRRSR